MTQRFEIWSTGVPGTRRAFHGEQNAETFQQACYEFAADHPLFKRWFNPMRLTYNGAELYPSEQALIDSFIKQEA